MNNRGFTLSEVLITIGVIGVVSAITMPVLIANIQQQTLNNKWKKAYRDINQAYLLVQSEEDLSQYFDCTSYYCFRPVVQKILKKYKYNKKNQEFSGSYNISEGVGTPKYKTILGEDISKNYVFHYGYFTDNMLIFAWDYSPGAASIWVDVNGYQKPNIIGKDLFAMYIIKQRVVPYGQYGTADWCAGYGDNINKLTNLGFVPLQFYPSKYYAGIGCSYEVLYGKKK